MFTFSENNPNQMLPRIMMYLQTGGREFPSRNGRVLRLPAPVLLEYKMPNERVLFHPKRNPNPFFHLMDALYLLNGNKDVKTLEIFNKNIAQYSDDGLSFHAPYGYRLRDQFHGFVKELAENHDSRRAVLCIWQYDKDLNVDRKDIPCNNLIYGEIMDGLFNMTVINRSNDVIWGMLGSNVVQFSLLQEFLAAFIGVPVGKYYHISNNCHTYIDNPQTKELLNIYFEGYERYDYYERSMVEPLALVQDTDTFVNELTLFMSEVANDRAFTTGVQNNPFIERVAIPMVQGWRMYKSGHAMDARQFIVENMADCDWRMACIEWIDRRIGR